MGRPSRPQRGEVRGFGLFGPLWRTNKYRRKAGRIWLTLTCDYDLTGEHTEEVIEIRPGDGFYLRFQEHVADGHGGFDIRATEWHGKFSKEPPE